MQKKARPSTRPIAPPATAIPAVYTNGATATSIKESQYSVRRAELSDLDRRHRDFARIGDLQRSCQSRVVADSGQQVDDTHSHDLEQLVAQHQDRLGTSKGFCAHEKVDVLGSADVPVHAYRKPAHERVGDPEDTKPLRGLDGVHEHRCGDDTLELLPAHGRELTMATVPSG